MPTRLDAMKSARLAKLHQLSALGIDSYPSVVERTHTCHQAAQKDGIKATVVGRLVSWRGHGKLQFADLKDESGKLQLAFKADILNPDEFTRLPLLDPGDFIQAQGETFTTKSGERTLQVTHFTLLCKTLNPLPISWYGFKDIEERYRKRYLDLILNPEVKHRFILRSDIIQAIRDYLHLLGFKEVETPTLQPIYGGGFARPFKTHHHVLDADFYLRISDEMYLKRLIVGGFEKVYEITKVFRNEGVDFDHNPEFTMFEAQIAYQDYTYGMDLIEEIIEHTAQKVLGKTTFDYQGVEVSVQRPWPRLRYVEAIRKYCQVDPLSWENLDQAQSYVRSNLNLSDKALADLTKMQTLGEIIALVFEEKVESQLIQPTIIYDYPIEISPLAKKCPDPRFTQRFEMFAFGSELGNNYTELNDPIDLKQRFIEEKKREQAGFAEAHQTDYDYLEAIEHGFPPTCGIAIGIDRLVMLLTVTRSIKEVIAFPTLKPETKQTAAVKPDHYQYSDKKIVLIVDETLPPGKLANAVGHLAFAGGHEAEDGWFGQAELTDADYGKHPGIARYPVIVLQATTAQLAEIRRRALENNKIQVRDFPKAMFTTAHDDELSAKLAKQTQNDIVYQALLILGNSQDIDSLTQALAVLK